MFRFRMSKFGGALALSAMSAACVSAPNAFELHDRSAARPTAADAAQREHCRVMVLNGTPRMLETGYRIDGVPEDLGLIPEGGRRSFDVRCDFGKIEAYGVSNMGVMAGAGEEYRKVARLDRSGVTRVTFSSLDRVR